MSSCNCTECNHTQACHMADLYAQVYNICQSCDNLVNDKICIVREEQKEAIQLNKFCNDFRAKNI